MSPGHHHGGGGDSYSFVNGIGPGKNMSASQQNQSSFEVWNSFFLSAGIPSSVSHDYAVTFSQHRIQIDMLKEITKDILLDMGIKAMGDIIAILRHAKSICTQNELKPSGIVKPVLPINHIASPAAAANVNSSTLSQRMPITTASRTSLRLAPATGNAGGVGNKIQSRLNLSSGAVIASSSLSSANPTNNGFSDGSRTSSSLSSSLAKRLQPPPSERKLNLDLTEKTLTVHYPSRSAIAKAAQRISGSTAPLNLNPNITIPQSSSIKSRLGSARASSSSERFESNSGNTIRIKNDHTIGKHNLRTSSTHRRESGQSTDRTSREFDSNARPVKTRLKSTVFSRLGQSIR